MRAPWTDDNTETMVSLWNKGLTAREIGETLNISRSSVLGRLSRVRARRPDAVRQRSYRTPPRPANAPAFRKPKRRSPSAQLALDVIEAKAKAEGTIQSIMKLGPSHCRFVLGDPSADRYCGRPVIGRAGGNVTKSYCADHANLIVRRGASPNAEAE